MSPALGDGNKYLYNKILPYLFAGDMGMSPLHFHCKIEILLQSETTDI